MHRALRRGAALLLAHPGRHPQTTLLGGGPHAIDTLRWLMGARFVAAQALHAGQRTRWNTLHTTVATFKTDNGGAAKVTVSYGMARPYCLYYSVYGAEGTFERTRDQGGARGDTVNYLYHSRLSGSRRLVPVTLPNWSNPKVARRYSLGHGTMEIEQAEDFVRAIRDDLEPKIGPREAARSIGPAICALQFGLSSGPCYHGGSSRVGRLAFIPDDRAIPYPIPLTPFRRHP